jgi:DNA-binding MarR family transcriptional regulator
MSGIIKKISTAQRNSTTYTSGLLQAKAYRALKKWTTNALKSRNISTIDWALLGLLYEKRSGYRPSELASELGVEAPFITALVTKLKKQHYVESKRDTKDTRVKCICLTAEGSEFVQQTETFLRSAMRPLIHDISIGDIISYLIVLEKIIENEHTL